MDKALGQAYDFAYDFGFTISVRRPKSYEKRGFLRHDFRNSIYDFSTILVLAFGRSSGTMVAASVGWPPIGRRRDTTLLIPIISISSMDHMIHTSRSAWSSCFGR